MSTGETSESSSSISSTLLAQLQVHDTEAWRRLVDLYGPLVYHWCRRSGLRTSDAADVSQDVFAAVSGRITAFRRGGQNTTFRGWLWTITRNKIRDHFRVQGGQVEAIGGTDVQLWLADIPDECTDSSIDEDRRELGGLFQRALGMVQAEFEDRTWNAFWRIAVEGQDTADVAAELGISANAVRQAKSRVLRRLRAELGDLID
jgi:RNA polymerase sigma-70 factor (ECF subfamily)